MSEPHVKLTETFAIKIDDVRLAQFRALAELDGPEAPELARQLIDRHTESEKKRHEALDLIFGQNRGEPK